MSNYWFSKQKLWSHRINYLLNKIWKKYNKMFTCDLTQNATFLYNLCIIDFVIISVTGPSKRKKRLPNSVYLARWPYVEHLFFSFLKFAIIYVNSYAHFWKLLQNNVRPVRALWERVLNGTFVHSFHFRANKISYMYLPTQFYRHVTTSTIRHHLA